MQLTLIRHLPTEWNKKTWLQGKKDIELSTITEEYQAEIKQNQGILKTLAPFEVVLASTLKRTHQTAELYRYQPETEHLLDELDFGPFEGRPKSLLLEKYGDQWTENPKGLVLGESLTNLEKRIVGFLHKYKESEKILVFGHGSWIRALSSYYHYGHINNMNKMNVNNNECITLNFFSDN
jgi:broad specificity phosphatase PhoE